MSVRIIKEIEIDGKTYKIAALNLNDLVELEEEWGEGNFEKKLATMKGNRHVLWKSLKKCHPDITEAEVGELFDISIINELGGLIENQNFPPQKKGGAKK